MRSLREVRAVEDYQRVGDKALIVRQLEDGVSHATPGAGEVGVRSLPEQLAALSEIVILTPEDEPAEPHWGDFNKPAEVLPDI